MAKILGSTMPKANSWSQEIALHLVQNAKGVAETFVQKRKDEASLSDWEGKQHERTEAIPPIEQNLASQNKVVQEAEAAEPETTMIKVIIGVVLFIVPGIIFYLKRTKEAEALAVALTEATKKRNAFQNQLGEATKSKEEAEERVEHFTTKIKDETPTGHSFEIGKVFYPLHLADFNGSKVALDIVGKSDVSRFSMPDLAKNLQTLEEVDMGLEAVSNPPVILQVRDEDENDFDSLIGEEAVLKKVVDDYQEFVYSIEIEDVDLPLVSNDSPLAEIVAGAKVTEASIKGLVIPEDKKLLDKHLSSMNHLVNMLENQEKYEQNKREDVIRKCLEENPDQNPDKIEVPSIEESLENSFNSIGNTIKRYGNLRQEAISIHQEGLESISSRADWLNHNFYCPICNQSPKWIEQMSCFSLNPGMKDQNGNSMFVLDLGYEKTKKLFDDFCDWMQDDEKRSRTQLAKRLSKFTWKTSDQNLAIELRKNFEAYQKVAFDYQNIDHDNDEMEDNELLRINTWRNLLEFHGGLILRFFQSVLFDESSNLDKGSRLTYTPFPEDEQDADYQGEWKCGTCESTWIEGDEQEEDYRCGKISQLKQEVLIEMWNTLWMEVKNETDKSIHDSQKEIRDHVQRESVAITSIANNYRISANDTLKDMQNTSNSAVSNLHEFKMTVDQLDRAGFLPAVEKTRLSHLGSIDFKSVKDEASANEMKLSKRSLEQQKIRPLTIGHINMVQNPTFLFNDIKNDADFSNAISIKGKVRSKIKALEQKFELPVVSSHDERELVTIKDKLGAPEPVSTVTNSDWTSVERGNEVNVLLTAIEAKSKIKVIKAIREITGAGLKDAKTMVENLPVIVKEGVSKDAAEEIKQRLEAIGSTVEVN